MSNIHKFLFLQGPVSFFSRHFASYLEKQGATCLRINLAFSDWVCWLGKPSENFRGRFDEWPAYLRNYIRKHGVTTILYYADCFPYHRIAREIADELGIDAVAYENGYLRPNWLTFEKGGMAKYSHFPVDPGEILSKGANLPEPANIELPSVNFWVEAFWEVVHHMGNYLFHWTFHNYQSDKYYNPFVDYISIVPRLLNSAKSDEHANNVIDQLLQTDSAYWLFPLQMQNDYQLRVHSSFGHQSEALELVIRNFSQFADHNEKLIIKIHPMDNGIEPWQTMVTELSAQYHVTDRVVFIDGGYLEKLINHSKGVITINSTVGLHAIQDMKPVCVLGCAIYDIKGLTSDQGLQEFFQKPTKPNRQLLVAFIKLLAASIQIKGNFFTKEGRNLAIQGLSEKLLNGDVNSHGAFVEHPVRNAEKCVSKP